ncbi:MAG: type I-F CRISPR-associated protein Csy2 [Methylococcales bacterium]|nr:type I-F CRISPR-associated protein Csy2 [Methylococcales bacterium]
MSSLVVIPNIKIQNANALSSPYTIGFPAMTAWLGGVHALQRKLNAKDFPDLKFPRMTVACHQIDLQTHKGDGDYIYSIIGTSNPLTKTGSRPSFIEEARCHLTVSLVIEYEGLGFKGNKHNKFINSIFQQLHNLKLAGGDILSFNEPELHNNNDDKAFRKLKRKLMPSHCLVERRDLMKTAMEDEPDAIKTLLDYLTVQHRSETIKHEGKEDEIKWTVGRKEKGWIVPIATGFQGISELGQAKNQRDPNTLHRFAESVVTLGEFKMPYHFKKLDEMLWEYHTDLDNNLYLCQQKQPN